MNSVTAACVCVVLLSNLLVSSLGELYPDFGLNIVQMVTKHGYPIESHYVQTEDGYILTVHRIPHGLNTTSASTKAPVLVMHGLLSSSADFVNLGPGKAVAYLLADAGYDVWLGNQRGNTWGRNHTTLDPDLDAEKFFTFSFHEIGMYDLPATIDHILSVTGFDGLSYIGHSQGTTDFFAMASQRPEYNAKIRTMVALAPVAYMEHIPCPLIRLLMKYYVQLEALIGHRPSSEFLRYRNAFKAVGRDVCSDTSPVQELCAIVIFVMSGFDSPEFDRNQFPVLLSNLPAGASTRQLEHYLQEINSTKFAQFDYGESENFERYGQSSPPDYDTSLITAPVILHYSLNDYMTSPVDVEKLAGELPNAILKQVRLPKFSHFDFIFANDIVHLLNNEVIKELDQVN